MKMLFIGFTFCFVLFGCAKQQSYTSIIETAQQLSLDKDSTVHIKALELYEKAFAKYPDSIDDYSVYEASVVASDIKDFDKAFKYLKPIAALEEDMFGYPGWDYILGEYAEGDYKNLMQEDRWSALKEKAIINKKLFFEKLKTDEAEFFSVKKGTEISDFEAPELYQYLKTSNNYLPKKKQDYSISFKINDTVGTSYFVHLPKNYNPENKYAVLFYLHGAVRGNVLSEFETKLNLMYDNARYAKRAEDNNVILVFPKGDKNFNWMLGDDGFFMIPEIVNQLKTALNIDDNRIHVSGHSNGATGSFSYLVKQPTQFAGFYGFNTHPKVYTGGTFIENVLSRSYINFSTDQDYYYPPNANDSLNNVMASLNADYKDYRYNGFPHWFPAFEASEPAYDILFKDLVSRKRNPFPKDIQWEFDDNNYGTVDWIAKAKLDTLKAKKEWQKTLNFDINTWFKLAENDSLVEVEVKEKAFDFPRQSGKIKASYSNNEFRLETSRIKSVNITISPEMVDLNKAIKVYINGKLYFNNKIGYNRSFMLGNFNRFKDRNQLWINFIPIEID
ncbi:alpha/beta hydrolase-fold protein [uncultured Lacinutrix sp.]|uniref:alpha/beta hydrolase-fold protein n=1 Tax=uncultured Lacinutrix sp. TaxID=574032 RepID=UPI0026164AFD|nr:alpha/beta hydrolase-fold protein [uncultured Lacinutrix sp.]